MALVSANCLICQNGTLSSLCFSSQRLISNSRSGRRQLKACNFICSHQVSDRKNRILTVRSAAGTAISDVDEIQSSEVFTTDSWPEFAANVSGEWDGFGAEFTPEGQPVELPEQVVPEAYREWEVKVFDWQTQCPTLAQPNEPSLTYKNIKLLPTVGCEADAATRYSIDERSIGGVSNKVSAFAYRSSGSYLAVWLVRDGSLELEHCLINPKDKESRVRVYQVVHVDGTKLVLQSIRVFCELRYGPFRNGDQLGGCAIRDSAFASTAPTKASEVVGAWQGARATAGFDGTKTSFIQELIDGEPRNSIRDESSIVSLPRQLWCSLKVSEDGGTCCEIGWLFENGRAITSRCDFSNDLNLKEISIAHETSLPENA